MANLSFIRGTLAKVKAQGVVDGQLIIASDVGQLYSDVGTTRVPLNDIIRVATLPTAADADLNKIYYNTESKKFAVSDGTAWTNLNDKPIIVEGTDNGTIKVDGVAVPVHGLGTAAFENVDAFDEAGAAAAVQGDTEKTVADAVADAADAQSAADDAQAAADTAQETADAKVASVTKGDNSITIGGDDATAPTVAVAISAAEGNALTLATDGLKVIIPEAVEYTITKKATAESGYIASYELFKGDEKVGDTINIPKDYLVKSGEVKTVTVEDEPYEGAKVGDKYIDFVVNVRDASATEEHIYLPVNELVDVYTGSNSINISSANVVSAKVVEANGLSVGTNGIAMGLASESANGAMSSTDFTKLAGIEEGAEVNYISSVDAPFDVTGGKLSASEATASAAGLMSADDKDKLDDIAEGAQVNVIEAVTFNGATATISGKTAAITLAWTDL